MNKANDRQVAGTHYGLNTGIIQHWDFAHSNSLDYFQGQITKYVCRWKHKNGMEDLLKAQHFLEKYIELNEEFYRQEERKNNGEATPHYIDQDRR